MYKDDKLNNLIDILKGIISEKSSLDNAYIVGGAVRDILIQRPVIDIDIAINTDPYKIASLFADSINGSYVPLNKKFMTARVVKDKYIFDISILHNGSIEDDIKRRDFTINAMAISLNDKTQTIDLVDGIKDTNNKRIRLISIDNLAADPVRLIRAFRFMSSLEFDIESGTLNAVIELKHLIKLPAVERIYAELKILLSSNNAFDAVNLMSQTGLLFELIPEIAPKDFDANLQLFKEIENIFINLKGQPYCNQMREYFSSKPHIIILLKFAALFMYDQSRGTIHRAPTLITNILERFKASQKEIRYMNILTENICKDNICPYFYTKKKIDLARFLMRIDGHVYSLFVLSLSMVRVIKGTDEDKFIESAAEILSYYNNEYLPLSKKPRLINGDDLEEIFGIEPSVQFREILNMVEEKRLAGEICSKEEAVRVVEKFLADR
ncbi:MAG: CCA tRNA nucleotidyltransferase [Nitrospirae bacterium]|nr:CCA tRNA nucleotidyltransferase [Nitrospirota bacterium]